MTPNLMTDDMAASVAFYRDGLGYELQFAVDAGRHTSSDAENAVFCVLERDGAQLMLQTRESLTGDLPGFEDSGAFGGTVALYAQGVDPEAALARLGDAARPLGPVRSTWYGMREVTLRDPMGYVVTLAMPEGPPPPVDM
jgi:uncharacterized glyoxalase superfamily protein PhnB